jgi:AcrR family transcriptional regulator
VTGTRPAGPRVTGRLGPATYTDSMSAIDYGAKPLSVDPRVSRTRNHVLDHARQLLLEQGPAGMTFSALATRARVARQTLYRYWDGPEALVADLVRRRGTAAPAPTVHTREALTGYLRGLRMALTDPAVAAAYGMLMGAAGHVPAAAAALEDVMAERLDQLNARLEGLRAPLDEEGYSRLTGPLVHAHFLARREITDELIDRVVDPFC